MFSPKFIPIFLTALLTTTPVHSADTAPRGSWELKLGDSGVGYRSSFGGKPTRGYNDITKTDSNSLNLKFHQDLVELQRTKPTSYDLAEIRINITVFESGISGDIISEFECRSILLQVGGHAKYTVHSQPSSPPNGINQAIPQITAENAQIARLECPAIDYYSNNSVQVSS